MLELPELEVTKDRLRLALTGRLITGTELRRPECLRTTEPPLAALDGQRVRSVNRQGRFLLFAAEDRYRLCIQLASSGRLGLGPTNASWTRDHLAALHLDHGEDLRVIETGRTQRVALHLLADPGQVDRVTRAGLDPLGNEFSLSRFRSLLARTRNPLKSFLTGRGPITGIGPCYADEILFEARLAPFALTAALRPEETIRLYSAVKKTLHDAVLALRVGDRLPGPEDRRFLRVHGRAGKPCPACGSEIRHAVTETAIADYCPTCQTGGCKRPDKPLSDPTPGPAVW